MKITITQNATQLKEKLSKTYYYQKHIITFAWAAPLPPAMPFLRLWHPPPVITLHYRHPCNIPFPTTTKMTRQFGLPPMSLRQPLLDSNLSSHGGMRQGRAELAGGATTDCATVYKASGYNQNNSNFNLEIIRIILILKELFIKIIRELIRE